MKEVPHTFDGISKKFLKMISQFKSPRIDIVFDQYFTLSIKDCKRLRRNKTTSTVSIGPNQIRHHNFAELDDNFEKKCRSFDSSSLPPCKAELYQNLLRVRYVTKFWRNAHLKNPSSLSPIASGWIVDDKYDFVLFAGEQFPSSAADIVIKKPTLLENQNTKQDDDYDNDNNESSDNDGDYEDASVFCDTFTE
ncbi:uncharacterized protein TNCV_4761251 [Trichonephila clavipes]|uniref:Uncharacterized protein n=1 Tax=Trichonephila clavipes TaxID=2585209 RepID=A0A8X6RKJ1_TRICX|nr:uncharacterized protein TNCV_4761251 [Trichonephila clavipes]